MRESRTVVRPPELCRSPSQGANSVVLHSHRRQHRSPLVTCIGAKGSVWASVLAVAPSPPLDGMAEPLPP